MRGKTKLIVPQKKRANAVTLKLSGSCDHVTVMPVVSADEKLWNPAVIVQGKRHGVRRETDGSRKALHSYFPPGSYTYLREEIASMDSTIFSLWATKFVSETEDLRRRKGRLLLLIDGMGAHLKYNSLKTLKDAGIVVFALPAHRHLMHCSLQTCLYSPQPKKNSDSCCQSARFRLEEISGMKIL